MASNLWKTTVCVCMVITVLWASGVGADVRPSKLFVDGAVLQRDMKVPIWGSANDGENVTVSFRNQKVSTTATGGKWIVWLKPMKAGGPFTMTVCGENKIEINDIYVGEVWLASGQSNMDLPLSMTLDPKPVIEASKDPMLRHFKVPMASVDTPASEIDPKMQVCPDLGLPGLWEEAAPGTTGHFAAVPYYFARDLRKALNVPVGIINSALGGTMAQEWTRREALLANPKLCHIVEEPQPDSGGPYKGKPCGLYNGMIAPLVPYAIRGVIWYQGESDASAAYRYRTALPAMIGDWRKVWGEGDFLFLIVQIAPGGKIHPEPHESASAEVRESQLLTSRTIPKTALVVITDCGDENNVHPKLKEPVGARLALAARALAHREKIVYSGPMYKSIKIEGNKAVLTFDHVGGGLISKGGELTGFTVAGEDKVFHIAKAEISGDKVVVRCPDVPHPVAVRMGWAGYPVVNLYNKESLPASPFRTDEFPLTTQSQ
ncbi:MAG: sialate O-acetylesterase [Armatimonadota bacterium]